MIRSQHKLNYYIVLTSAIAKGVREAARQKQLPRKDLNLLAQNLNALFIEQQCHSIKPLDRILAKLSSSPQNWAFARSIASQLKEDDIVFCPGEEIGIPLAAIYSIKKKRPKTVVWFHRITGLRSRLALKVFQVASIVDAAVVSSHSNKKFLEQYLGFASDRILFWRHSVDCSYLAVKTSSSKKHRPLIISVGLEQRDYHLLASATKELNVDVKVAGFSQFQSRVAKSFPKILPSNMTNQKYQWTELIQLYHDADLVVIPLKENRSAAGVTVLLEAMIFQKPIICVRTKGLVDYLTDEQAVMTVKPGDKRGLQNAILYLLNDPQQAQKRAKRAYQIVWEKHNLDSQVEVLAQFIKALT